jgi:hypothetical protein
MIDNANTYEYSNYYYQDGYNNYYGYDQASAYSAYPASNTCNYFNGSNYPVTQKPVQSYNNQPVSYCQTSDYTQTYPGYYNSHQTTAINSPKYLPDQDSCNSSISSAHSNTCSPDTGLATKTTSFSSSNNSSNNSDKSSNDNTINKKKSTKPNLAAKIILPTISQTWSPSTLSNNPISVQLINKSLWDKFSAHQTEMIITKQGRLVSIKLYCSSRIFESN